MINFRKPNNPRQDKIRKGGSQILKFGKKVAAATPHCHLQHLGVKLDAKVDKNMDTKKDANMDAKKVDA